MTTLRDALGAPFVFRGQTVVSNEGSQRVVGYPELGCEVAGQNMLELMDQLEIKRAQTIVTAVAEQRSIVPLRPPVASTDVDALLRRAGLADWIPRLDDPISHHAPVRPLEGNHAAGARS